jgi:probable F420-dependent oxidoreductase
VTRHFVLVGLMGAGKTTVGRGLAEALGWPFNDSDAAIEREQGSTVRALADEIGVEAMHELEAAHLLRALADPGPSVIAAAASTIDDPECRAALTEPGIRTIWLKADPSVLARRFDRKRHRPRFGRAPAGLLAEQAREREPLFRSLHPVEIETAGKDPGEVVELALARSAAVGNDATVRLGVVFPQTEIGADPGGVRAFVEAVQAIGYDHLLVYDHVLGADVTNRSDWPGPYTSEHQFHELFVLFGYLAAIAPGLELVAGVLVLPQRQTALVAKQAAEVDILTAGRFRLGVGLGWNYVEYEALGEDFGNRGRRSEEQIEVLRRLWTEPVVDFEGRWHRIPQAGINPLPGRSIPIWIGGSAEAAIRRAARVADGFFPQRPLEGGWRATLERFRGWVVEAGRDPAAIGVEQRIDVGGGTPDDWRAAVDEWRDLGATHVSVTTMRGGLDGPDAHIGRIREAFEALA